MLLFSLLDYPQLIVGFILGALCILLAVKIFFNLFGPDRRYDRPPYYDPYRPYGGDYGEMDQARHRRDSSRGCLPLLLLLLVTGVVGLNIVAKTSDQSGKVQKTTEKPTTTEISGKTKEKPEVVPPAPSEPGLNQRIYQTDKREMIRQEAIKVIVPKPGQYFLQGYLFRDKPSAESYCRGLQNKDLPCCIVERQGSRFWGYAACAGPFKSWEEAVNVKQTWGDESWELFGEMAF